MQLLSFFHPTEQALSDIRRGKVVTLQHPGSHLVIGALETMSIELVQALCEQTQCAPTLIIPGSRLQYLYPNHDGFPRLCRIQLDMDSAPWPIIDTLLSGPQSHQPVPFAFESATDTQSLSLRLCQLAELMPMAILWTTHSNTLPDYLSITHLSADEITGFSDAISTSLHPVCEAPLTLEMTQEKPTSIIAYRSSMGGHEHYAILIGSPKEQESPLVRIHSSCYTGDLLASLKCDCRDQLHFAIAQMAEADGGIIIYLMQEGRGIGLANKLRTYALQNQGLDTVDANKALGFEDDERLFLPAASILKSLHVDKIDLLTNNPRKASGVEKHGIQVNRCVPHIMAAHEHNKDYLTTKKDRLGHTFE